MNETTFRTMIDRGVAAHQTFRVGEALECYRKALDLRPEDAEANSLYGLALVHSGRPEEAETVLKKAVATEPDQIGFRLNLAEFLEATGQFEEAMAEVDHVIEQSPDFARAWEKRGDLYIRLKKPHDASRAYAQAFKLAPGNFDVAVKLAGVWIQFNDLDNAKHLLDHAAKLQPDHKRLWPLYAALYAAQRDWPHLETTANRWLEADADNVRAWRHLATAAFEQGRYRKAMEAYAKVLELSPKSAETLSTYGQICLHALEFDAAAAALDEAEALDPTLARMLAGKGLLLTYLGRFDEAEAYCRRCLERKPDHVPVYTTLSRLKGGKLSDQERNTLTRLMKPGEAPMEHRIAAAFALAHDLDARRDIEAAFSAYEKANGLVREFGEKEGLRYDPGQSVRRTDQLMSLFAAPRDGIPAPKDGATPIFIVGMPRSGTTLIEGVLSAHSQVAAGGERPMMHQILEAYLDHVRGPDGTEPSPETLREWAAAYLKELPDIRPARWVTDKYPLNIEAVGLIAQLFPSAPIVHIRRNPLETGLSVFRQEFSRFWEFAHRLEDIGHFYGQYARLAAHWQRLFPDRFITIQYEAFCADFERAAPELLEACGLPWEDACRNFQTAERPIATFSTVQARQPVTVRNDRAHVYQPYLQPLADALRAADVDLDTGALLSDL